MILFPCEACGKVICADDQSAGQRVPCPHCQASLTVPPETVVDCCLVFQGGSQQYPKPMSSNELQEQLEQGNLKSCDLIWTKNAWRPLYQVLNLSLAVAPPQNDELEIAVHFEELSPLPGFAALPRRSKRKRRSPLLKITPASAEPVQVGPKTPFTVRLKKVIFSLVALSVLFFGVVRALRIYNYATNRFASVMIVNAKETPIAFGFPFSGFSRQTIPADGFGTQTNLVVGIPCKKSLKIWNLQPDTQLFDIDLEQLGKPDESISVPIRPNHDTVVNLGHSNFLVYKDFRTLVSTDALAPADRCQAAALELASKAFPTQTKRLFTNAKNILGEHLVKVATDGVFTDADYDLSELNILAGDRETPADKTISPPSSQNTLLRPTQQPRSFPGGYFLIRNDGDLLTLQADFPAVNYRLPIPQLEFEAKGKMTISQTANGLLKLEMSLQQSHSQSIPQQYRGSWRYFARETTSGNWEWEWLFTNTSQKTVRVAADGSVTALE